MKKINEFEKKLKIIEEYLKKWPTWVAIIFLFIPGILYQLHKEGIEYLINFQGSLIIIFLTISLYYSIPFIILGFFLLVLIEDDINNKINEGGFLLISIFGAMAYSIIIYISKGNFWQIYWKLFAIIFIAAIISIKLKDSGKKTKT